MNSMGKLVAASVGTVVGLYGVLLLLLIIIFELCGIGLNYLIISAAMLLLLDFLLAPIFMDISLNWFYKIKWRNKDEIPQYVADFIQEILRFTVQKRATKMLRKLYILMARAGIMKKV